MQLDPTTSSQIALSAGMQAYMGQSLRSEPVRQVNIPVSVQQADDTETPSSSISDTVTLSPEAQEAAQKNNQATSNQEQNENKADTSQQNLSAEEQKAVLELQQRDQEVRTHEQAHLAQAGPYAAGGMSFTYQQGPDGKRYAVGGEVPISLGKEATPEETILKMETVQRAAMAPAQPSAADRQIAASAAMKENKARVELQKEQTQESESLLSSATNQTDTDSQPSTAPQSSTDPIAYQSLDIMA